LGEVSLTFETADAEQGFKAGSEVFEAGPDAFVFQPTK
jgi:hypothetical protein